MKVGNVLELTPIEQQILDFISQAKTADLYQIAIAVNETSDITLRGCKRLEELGLIHGMAGDSRWIVGNSR